MLSWNVRRFTEPARAKEALKILVEYKVGLFALVETKVKKVNFDRITNRMGDKWRWIENYDCNESGRIVVDWDSSL